MSAKFNFGMLAAAAVGLAIPTAWVLSGNGGAGHSAEPPPVPAAIEVPVSAVVEKTVPVFLTYAGSTEAVRNVNLQAQATGYMQRKVAADGADVRQGQLLYQIDPRTYQAVLDQAKAQEQKDAAALQYAKANHQRNEALSRNGDVSLDTLQQSAASELQFGAAMAADHAAVETAELNLGYTEIHAPFSGRLGLSLVNEGALISTAGTQINSLVQLDPIYATFNPPDTDLPEIQRFQAKAPIPIDILAGSGADAVEYHGKLAFLDNSVGRATGTITARALIQNPKHVLLPGQFVRVRLHVADQPNTLLVPQVAVGSSQLGKYVYVVGRDNRIEQRFVTLGADYDPTVAVTKGLARGETVVVGNLLRVGPGIKVQPIRAGLQATASVK